MSKREQKFTEKRNPYKRYLKAKWDWSNIFNEINLLKMELKTGYIKIVSEKYGINYKTLLNKYNNYTNNKIDNIDCENRGGNNKIFSDKEEDEIFNFIKTNFIDKNRMLCNDIIKFYALDKFKQLNKEGNFNASDGWCTFFKQKYKLSTVKCSISKIATTVYSNDDINIFLENCKESKKLVGDEYFFNLDQTKWNNINVSLTTIHIKGSGVAKINVNGNDKDGFTATIIISADGEKLKPVVTVKGKTSRCLKKYNLDSDKVIGTFSNNGWVNNGILKILLETIYESTKGSQSVLLLDQFPVHVDDFVKNEALSKNIKLIFVPKGLTYKYQPLDVLINGIIKQKAKAMWRKEIIKDPDVKITNTDAIKHFVIALDEITSENIKQSFNDSCFTSLK